MDSFRVPRAAVSRAALLAFGAALAACNHYHKTDVPPADVRSIGSVSIDLGATRRHFSGTLPSQPVDDWTTYAHDFMRTAYEPQDVGIERGNLADLALAWHVHLPGPVKASPLVAGGAAYFATRTGSLVALDAATGAKRWVTSIADGDDIGMTPTLADGKLFAGTESGTFAAVDAATGRLLWKRTMPGIRRGEPAVVGGLVFEGRAGGDPPECTAGGVDAFDERTGATAWSWRVSDRTDDGGSVWSPIMYDGRRLFFGTGNTCHHISPNADAVVSLTTAGEPVWVFTSQDSRIDVDLGSAVQRYGNVMLEPGKDGTIVAIDATTGKFIARRKIPNSVDGFGSIGAASTDGTTLVVTGGSSASPEVPHVKGSLTGFDRHLGVKWSMRTPFPNWGYVAIADGIGFTTLAEHLVAIDPATGRTLWSAALSSDSYASPAIVPSGLYAVDLMGDAYAFRLPRAR